MSVGRTGYLTARRMLIDLRQTLPSVQLNTDSVIDLRPS
jgi:hypothetical protein